MTDDEKDLAQRAEEFLRAQEVIEMCRQSEALRAYLIFALANMPIDEGHWNESVAFKKNKKENSK